MSNETVGEALEGITNTPVEDVAHVVLVLLLLILAFYIILGFIIWRMDD